MKKNDILILFRSSNTVFTFKDISLLWGATDMNKTKRRINYYVKKGDLYSIRRGIYAKDSHYDRLELGTKIFTPSYISFETVTAQAGMTFQYYERIFVASTLTREIVADGQIYQYKKIKDSALTSLIGLERKNGYLFASPERAFLDIVYLNRHYYFDHLGGLNWDKIFEILPIYSNKSMEKGVNQYYKGFKDDN